MVTVQLIKVIISLALKACLFSTRTLRYFKRKHHNSLILSQHRSHGSHLIGSLVLPVFKTVHITPFDKDVCLLLLSQVIVFVEVDTKSSHVLQVTASHWTHLKHLE